jgi:hypothetical protein
MFWKIAFKKRFLLAKPLVLLIALLMFSNGMVNAQMDSRYLEARSARLLVTGVDANRQPYAKALSSFLWQSNDQIVTSLHGIPPGSKITATCMGVTRAATVQSVLPYADLILLKTDTPFSSCSFFTDADFEKPAEGTKLWTFGWHAGANGGSSRHFEKGYGSPEILGKLVSGDPLKALQLYNIPSTALHIYYVQGGLLPGYSGGPVVNAQLKLIGIVDGGLNKGTSDYNWVIPAKHLAELVNSGSTEIPPEVATMNGFPVFSASQDSHANSTRWHEYGLNLFASGIADGGGVDVIQYNENGIAYEWVKTKTQSLDELGQTADDAEGVGQLLDIFAAAAGLTSAKQLSFDVYEELEYGLIITVPRGQGLAYREGLGLVSEHNDEQTGLSTLTFNHASTPIVDAYGKVVRPNETNYFQEAVSQLLVDCQDPGINYCKLDESTLRIVDFGGGNRILKLGITNYDVETQSPEFYEYHSIAVSGGIALGAEALIYPSGQVGLFQCLTDSNRAECANNAPAQLQLSQLIAVHLTSFADLNSYANQKIVQEQFVYDTSKDFHDTVQVPFYEGNTLRFYNTRGTEWIYYLVDNEQAILHEYKQRSDGYAYLKYDDHYISVPVAGGQYYIADEGGAWAVQGTLQR